MLESEEQILSKQPYVSISPLHITHSDNYTSNVKDESSSTEYLEKPTSVVKTKSFKISSSTCLRCEICLKMVSNYIQCNGYCSLKFCSACCGIADIKRTSKIYRQAWKCKYCRKKKITNSSHLHQKDTDTENVTKKHYSCPSSQDPSSGESEDSSTASSDSESYQENRKNRWVSVVPAVVNGRWKKRKRRKLDGNSEDFKLNGIQLSIPRRKRKARHCSSPYTNYKHTKNAKVFHNLRSSVRKKRKYYKLSEDSSSDSSSSKSPSSSSSTSPSSDEDDDKTCEEQRTVMNKAKSHEENSSNEHFTRSANGSGKCLRPKPTPTLRYKMVCGACSISSYSGELIDCTGPCSSSYHYHCMGISRENFEKLSKLAKSKWKCAYCKAGVKKPVASKLHTGKYTSRYHPVGMSGLMSNVICGACSVGDHNSELISCVGPCCSRYHYYCIGMSKENFQKLSQVRKSSWKCKKCKASTKATSASQLNEITTNNSLSRSLQVDISGLVSDVICGACSAIADHNTEVISCVGPCCSRYHYYCVGMSKQNFAKLSRVRRSSWRCRKCRKNRRTAAPSETYELSANNSFSSTLQATVVLERLPIKSQLKNKDAGKTSNSKPNKSQKQYKIITTRRQRNCSREDSEDSDSDFFQYRSNREILDVTVGDFVWAKLGSQRWWPALVIWGSDCGQPPAKHNYTWVLWCGDHKISEVPKNKLLNFITHFNRKFNGFAGYKFEKGIVEVLTELADRAKVQGISKEAKPLLTWAKNGFPCAHKKSNPFAPDPDYPISGTIRKQLNRIKAQYLKTMWSEQGVSLTPRFLRSEQLQDEESALKKVREGILKIQEVCIACDTNDADIVSQHPLIEGGLCSYCRDEITETMFAYGDDGTNAYCVICGQAGQLLICDNHECNRCYCTGCIDVLVSPEAHVKARKISPWLCYLCHPYDPEVNGLIKMKEDWQQSVMQFFKSNENVQFPPNMDDYKEKKPIRVLSLFDGIGTGRLVLEQLGIEVDVYYASEIDKDAINISLVQHKGNIIHLGDIEDITDVEVGKLCPIDLVIGGSPCNDLALVNPRRKGLYDPTGTGKLFFDFFRVLRAVQMANKGRHLFWLYENVAGMPSQYKSTITRFLQCEPTLVDAKHFSAQRRARFFWGNIPGMYTVQEYWSAEEMPNPLQQEELHQPVTLNSVLTPYLNRKAALEKIGSVTTQINSLRQGKSGRYPVTMNGEEDILWITELEQVFGFPRHYTDIGNVHLSRRQQLLGKAWSVPVIRHLFTSLKNFFKTSPSIFLQNNSNTEI